MTVVSPAQIFELLRHLQRRTTRRLQELDGATRRGLVYGSFQRAARATIHRPRRPDGTPKHYPAAQYLE